VWFWNHELDGNPDALTRVSASLAGFLSALKAQLVPQALAAKPDQVRA